MTDALRPRPSVNLDNGFVFEALNDGRLVIQKCDGCAELRHPPVPMCPSCHSLDWHGEEMSGRGTLFSYVVLHHPVVPPFRPGYVVALVELEEGARVVMPLEDVARDDIEIGMALSVAPERMDDELTLPVARVRAEVPA
ncbi:OB-fold domain-containing protein [Gordonia sp. HY285]|uniref:Zn-ribbon domain-containing OB-fold protein n=1 Tax=Gordonia liuliyuniae TaxID=2911517 RepID=UPI001F45ED9C|nr:OB-fold domain-containing protein [Gordonia liuliyuniae]MCF8609274.1 OB-fold domain-containing protein [Gordonia liuliyuniae]